MKNWNCTRLWLLFTIVFGYNFVNIAQIPINPSVQMLITDNAGSVVVDGNYQITTTLYESPSGTSSIWTETQTANVTKGLANLILGASQPLNLTFAKPYYLGISIDNGSEMTPRLELNSSAYSLAARAVYGTTNIFPATGSVGIGTYSPQAKLDIRGDLSILDIPVADSSLFYRILVHDTLDQIVKYIPSSLTQGEKGDKGEKGDSGSMGFPGEDLVVRNNDSIEVFRINATDGTSFHAGTETFRDSIVVEKEKDGSRVEITPDGNLLMYDSFGKNWLIIGSNDSINNKKINTRGVLNPFENEKEEILNTEGNNNTQIGPDGSTFSGMITLKGGVQIPLIGNGGTMELLPDGGIIYRDIDGNTTVTISPDGSRIYPPLEVPFANGGRLEMLPNGGMTMWDPDLNAIFRINSTDAIFGLPVEFQEPVEFQNDIRVVRPDFSDPLFEIDSEGRMICRDSTGNIVGTIGWDGWRATPTVTNEGGLVVPLNDGGRIEILPDDGMTMWDPDGSIITRFNSEGSYHARLETHPGGIEIPSEDGGGIEMFPEGDFTLRDADGNIITNFNDKGSYHAELSEFDTGLDVKLENGGKVHLCNECGLVLKNSSGDDLFKVDPDGVSYHVEHSLFFGGINTFNSDANPSIRAQAIMADQITAAEKNFRIDHPLDPANKYLYHTSMESSERLNLYNGNILLDEKGHASIILPDWFEALNENYRYQLTPIGGAAPNLYIDKEVDNNKFSIAGGSPGMKISWQITGTRKDAYAKATPVKIEVDKPVSEKGKYWDTPVDTKRSSPRTTHECNSNFKKHNFLKK